MIKLVSFRGQKSLTYAQIGLLLIKLSVYLKEFNPNFPTSIQSFSYRLEHLNKVGMGGVGWGG